MRKKRYFEVGLGGRAANFVERAARDYPDSTEFAGFCDISQVRMDYYNRRLQEQYNYAPVPTCKPDGFASLVKKTSPDHVIVTSMDSTHHDYIIQALRLGCDVITEKPMTVDAGKCRAILDAVKETGRKVRVTFNYRWMGWNTRVKEVLNEGVIGDIKSVNMEYLLDTSHGADYYRRWHARMENCGGLLVHKATHHFDLVNWWVDSIPEEVFAFGDLVFYGKENALARGDEKLTRYPRYTGYPEAQDDPFKIELDKDPAMKGLYYDAETETGYLRDRNVFRGGIDIYDSMSLNVRYRNGVLLTYSLNSYSPREGMRVTFNGNRGRLEYYELGPSHINRGQSEVLPEKEKEINKGDFRATVFPHFKLRYDVGPPPKAKGGHGGSDPRLCEQIFSANPPEEKLGRNAGHEQGAASILAGIAANISIKENRPVKISGLLPLKPDASRLSELV